jgi:hypothetical protein
LPDEILKTLESIRRDDQAARDDQIAIGCHHGKFLGLCLFDWFVL